MDIEHLIFLLMAELLKPTNQYKKKILTSKWKKWHWEPSDSSEGRASPYQYYQIWKRKSINCCCQQQILWTFTQWCNYSDIYYLFTYLCGMYSPHIGQVPLPIWNCGLAKTNSQLLLWKKNPKPTSVRVSVVDQLKT